MDRDAQFALIDRFYDEMWNRFDKTVFPEILDPTIRFRGSLGQVKVGFDELGDYLDYIQAFAPDFHNEVVSTITEGNQTFARLSYTGTHQGEIFGLAPSNRDSSTPAPSCSPSRMPGSERSGCSEISTACCHS